MMKDVFGISAKVTYDSCDIIISNTKIIPWGFISLIKCQHIQFSFL